MSAKDSDKGAANSEPTGLSEEALEGASGGAWYDPIPCSTCGQVHPYGDWNCP